MQKRKVSFETLGCRYNRYESAEIAYELDRAGYEMAPPDTPADVVVINTCAVTGKSAARCRSAIRHAKAANPGAWIVVTGCYSETNPGAVAGVEGVDIVAGNAEKFDIAGALSKIDPGGRAKVLVGGALPATLPVRPVTAMAGRTNAYLNVQSGCDEVCSFCLVRLARGKSRSAEPELVVDQVARMAAAGIREVVLSGINVGQYGAGTDMTLARLVRLILSRTAIGRVRLSSVNPNDVSGELIDLMAAEPRFCRHLHIPLQSGSDAILERMRRPYRADDYEALLEKLVARAPGIGLGADVMVGFPGETDRRFRETFELLERSPVMMLHVFAYSPRKGAEAFDMDGAPPKPVVRQRSAALKELSREKGRAMRRRFVNQTLETLIENTRGGDGYLRGFTANYLPVRLEGPDELMNRITPVKMIRADGDRLTGEAV